MNQVPAKLYHGTNKDKTKEVNKQQNKQIKNKHKHKNKQENNNKTEQKTRIRNQVYVTFLSVLKIARMQDTRCCWMKKNPTKLLIRLVGQRYNEDKNIDE